MQERVVREIRMLRVMWRELETGSRTSLAGHEGGNSGYRQGVFYRVTAPALDPTTSGKSHVGIFCEQVTSTPLFTGVREISSSATFIATWGRLRPDGSAGSRRGGAIIYLRGRISDSKNGFEFRACDQNADGISLELVAGASIVIDR